jgi:4-alpha-glucanotransferase
MTEGLAELAAAHGVATSYVNGDRERVEVADDVVRRVLGLLGVDADTPEAITLARNEIRAEAALPPTIVAHPGEAVALPGPGTLRLEDGTTRPVEGTLPADLPLGWHAVTVAGNTATVIVAPRTLAEPPRAWGWMVQVYALHSATSWGAGDYTDLAELVRWSAQDLDAGVVLVNPMHAPTPLLPFESSPYTPSSRRFRNPFYLDVTAVPGYDPSMADQRPPATEPIDYDAVWSAKQAVLQQIFAAGARPEPTDGELHRFAVFCALAERHGRNWREWPAELRHPDSPAVPAAAAELADRVDFHVWSQQLCERQLGAVGAAAAGMAVGVVHDLAVGVDPNGADAWALQDVLAGGATVGAPPDAFSQQGQDWALSPWHPRRLAEAGYRPYRDVVRAALSEGGGIRVDHVAGLWRLWWVPPGQPASAGTYVHYDAKAMLGVLALEAHRAGAVVIGEDLGTVEAEVTETLGELNALGCAVLWFQKEDDGAPDAAMLPAARYPKHAAASISTHDLPTAAGFLRGAHVQVRADLGLLTRDVAQERAGAEHDVAELLALLRSEGLLAEGADEAETIEAMHRFLARTPCRLRLVSPYDVLGESRQPNLPGTTAALYPNWRLPLPQDLASIQADPRVARVAQIMREP